eukprot:5755013-Alexandrium_andersonii.AAC.1
MGEESTSHSNADQEFSYRYFDVDPEDSVLALGLEYFRPGSCTKGELGGYTGFYLKQHGMAAYFGNWLRGSGHITPRGIFRQGDRVENSIRSFITHLCGVFAVHPEVHYLLTSEATA